MSKVFRFVLGLCAVIYLAVYIVLALKRISYPYELEWTEGLSVDHIVRVLSGRDIYVEPSLDFIPFFYTPLFHYVGALFSTLFGIGFRSLRLVSFLASLGCFVILFEFVRRETGSMFFGLLSAGLFSATYRIAGAWLDIARPDSLLMLCMLSSAYVVRFHDTARSVFVGALLMFLAFFTKQTAMIMAIAMSMYCLVHLSGWKKLIYPATFTCACGISSLILNVQSNGWYYYYVFHLTRRLQLLKYQLVYFWLHDMNHLAIAFAISVAYCAFLLPSPRQKGWGFYFLFLGGMVGTSWVPRLFAGSYDNALLPAYGAISIMFAVGSHALTSGAAGRSAAEGIARAPDRAALQRYFVLAACLLQFAFLGYDPFAQVPSRRDVSAGNALVERLRSTQGEVFLPFHGFLPSLAGKKTYAHASGIDLVLSVKHEEQGVELRNETLDAIRSRRFEAIVMDRDCWGLDNEIRKEYPTSTPVFSEPDVFWPVTGMRTRPTVIYELSK